MANWNNPTLMSTYIDVPTELKDRDTDTATWLEGSTSTNIPINAKRYNASSNTFETWDGASWNQLDLSLASFISGVGNNQVLYTNGSGTVTGSSGLTFDGSSLSISGNLGVTGNASVTGNLAVDTSTLVVDAANNRVGIGTSSPTHPLSVVGGSIFNVGSYANGYAIELAATTETGRTYRMGMVSGGDCAIYDSSVGQIRFRIADTGEVSIGTHTALGKLDSRATSGAQIVASYDGSNYTTITTNSSGDCTIAPSGGDLAIIGNLAVDTDTLFVDAANNRVGIGTTSTLSPLHVKGLGQVAVFESSSALGSNYFYFRGPSGNLGYIGYGSGGNNHLSISNETTDDIIFLIGAGVCSTIRSTGDMSVGGSFTALGRLDARSTSGAQLVASYDGSNYTAITTNSSGDCTIAPSGGDLATTGNMVIAQSSYKIGLGSVSGSFGGAFCLNSSTQHADYSTGVNCIPASDGNSMVTANSHSGISGSSILFRGNKGGQTNDILFFSQAQASVTAGSGIALTAARMFIKGLTGNVGVGGGYFTPLGRLDSRTTSGAQLVASYDGSNYTAITTNSSGDCAIAPSGGDLAITGNASVTGNLAVDTSTLVVDAANNRVGINTVPSFSFHLAGSTFRHQGTQYDVLPGAATNFEFVNRNGYGFDWYVNSASLKPMRLDLNGNLLLGTDDLSSLDGTSGIVIGGIHEALAFAPTGSKARIIYNSSDELRIYDSTANINCVVLMSNHRWKMNYGFETGIGAWNAISDRLTFVSSTGYSHHQMSIQDPGSGLTQLYFRNYTNVGSDGFTGGEWLQFTHDSKILLGATGAVPTQAYKLPGGSFQFTGVITSGSFGRLWKPGQLFSSVPYAGQYGLSLTYNAYYDGGWKSVGGGTGGALSIDEGILAYHTSNSVGSADAALTWTPRLVVEPSFGAGIGIANPNAGWHVVVNDGSYSLAASGSSCALRVTHSSGTTSLDSVDPTLSASYKPLNLQGSYLDFSVAGYNIMRLDSAFNLGVGITSSIAAKIHSVTTSSEQLRLGYNGSLFWGFGVNNGGQLNLTPSQGSTLRLVNSSIYSDYGYYFVDDRDIKPNQIPAGTLSLYFHTQGGMTGTSNNEYLDAIFLNSWSDSSGGAVNAITFSKNVGKRVQLWQAVQSATSWGTPSTFAFLEHTQIFTAQQEIVFAGRQFSLSYSGTHSTDLYTDSLGIMNIAPSGSGLNVNFTNGTTFFRIRDKNLQLGTETASGWGSDFKTYSSGYSGFGSWFNTIAVLSANAYNDGTNWLKRNTSAFGSLFVMNNGGAAYLAIANSGSSYNFNNIKFYTNYSGGISFLKGSPTSYAIEVGNNTSNGNGAYLSLTGTWTTTSDRSKKYDIYDCSYGLNEVLAMNPRFFKYLGSTETQIGFIAQELKSVIPEAVDGEEPKLAIKYNHLIPVLVKAIGELKAEIEDLRSQITN